ncbi:winged helix DNA-binding domain-containing protein [Ruminococcaceae bacterium OttesenSCG-928-N02]|nr:winged helix DNA-binding domain-containing protein [Ruminococcaceae bacterium OttesenSCG-928-N02]
MDKITHQILRTRMHGLYISRACPNLTQLAHELLGMHCWFHRNVAFSALLRGAPIAGWKTALTKTWLYRGTLHGVPYDDLPLLLSLHADLENEGAYFNWLGLSEAQVQVIGEKVLALMEDGVYSRAEMRRIFVQEYEPQVVEKVFSSWGGIFVPLARQGKVAFRNMTSRDFDLIEATPSQNAQQALPELLRRYFSAYGPATLADAAWFFGLMKSKKHLLDEVDLSEFLRLEHDGDVYYYTQNSTSMAEIPPLQLLSGFDPLIVSYANRNAILPQAYKKAVILKSGICLPSIAINGKVAGIWNIKNGKPVLEFFEEQPRSLKSEAFEMVDEIRRKTAATL